MKKLLLILAALGTLAMAQPNPGKVLAHLSMVVASTDLTNLSKSEYGIFVDLADTGIVSQVYESADRDLCKSEKFAGAVGKVVCQGEVKFHKASKDAADIVITDKVQAVKGKVLVVCTDRLDGCDLTIKKGVFEIRTDEMKKKGFVPDPTLQAKKR